MKDRKELRLKKIKLRYKFAWTECHCCGNEYRFEKMWRCYRYCVALGTNIQFNYCMNCMPSKEDVLNEIDTDEWPYGLARVDDYIYKKKNYSRMRAKQRRFNNLDEKDW